jgi:hypothetical protein
MTDLFNFDDFVFNFQAEHIIADALFKRGTLIGDFLADMGYKKNENGDMMRIKSINEYFSID